MAPDRLVGLEGPMVQGGQAAGLTKLGVILLFQLCIISNSTDSLGIMRVG
jgi:hypothetical protein